MIQRIQTLYLLAATLCVALFYFFPLAVFESSTHVFEFFACYLASDGNSETLFNLLPLSVLPALSLLISLLAIFSFKNRSLQIKLGRLNYLVLLAVLAVSAIFYYKIGESIDISGKPGFVAILPLVAIFFIFMANKAIKKDDNLVKSADRIR